jgi:predicted phage terminase large subunit-like protein
MFQWDTRHHEFLIPKLQEIADGEGKRIVISLPPRHGKSALISERFPAYLLNRYPTTKVGIVSYSQELANNFSRRARGITEEFLTLNPERTAVSEWQTLFGGSLIARGHSSSITGFGIDFLLIDDLIKNVEEASNPKLLEKIYDSFASDIFTRLEGKSNCLVIGTRWSEDDIIGRLLKSEVGGDWETINIPAIAMEDDPLGRSEGEALWPERFSLEKLDEIQKVLGARQFDSLYQGLPRPRSTEFFLVDNIGTFKRFPNNFRQKAQVFIGVDKAASKGRGDYSSFAALANAGDAYYVLDILRGQWGTHEREQKLLRFVKKYVSIFGQSRVKTVVEIEPGSGGKDSYSMTARTLAGYRVVGHRVTGGKEIRAEPFAAQVEAGNVMMKVGPWNDPLLREMKSFPGTNDDQVDSLSIAFNKLAKTRKSRIF